MPAASSARFAAWFVLAFGFRIQAASVPGIQNFDEVGGRVYRGAQPSDEGFRYLAKIGVRTVLDLREADERSAAEKRAVTGLGMKYVNVPMTGLTAPTDAQIASILALLESESAGPVFVHCKRGADRTGVVIAAYLIDSLKWDNARALQDAKAHHMGYFQFPRQNYIRNFRPRVVSAGAEAKRAPAQPLAEPVPATPATAGAQD
jgi:protein-tyrosine phosphatase